LTDPTIDRSRDAVGASTNNQEGPQSSREGSRAHYGQPTACGRPRPLLDGEPRRIPGLEVTALVYESDPAVDRLDLPLVPPRQRPDSANHPNRQTTTISLDNGSSI
jgi:hypothetical protein